MRQKVEIIEYQERYKEDFKEISYQWLKENDVLERIDIHIIENFEKIILEKGGHMFFARMGKEIVGTVSLIRIDDDTYELAKFGVKEDFQGNSIGTKLLKKCIEVAREDQAKRIVLETMSELEASIHLYRKMGFKELEDSADKYETTDKAFVLYL